MGGYFHFAGGPDQALVLERLILDQLMADEKLPINIDMGKNAKKRKNHLRPNAGITMIETLWQRGFSSLAP